MRRDSDVMGIGNKRKRLLRKGKPILKRTRDIDRRKRRRRSSGGSTGTHSLGRRSIH